MLENTMETTGHKRKKKKISPTTRDKQHWFIGLPQYYGSEQQGREWVGGEGFRLKGDKTVQKVHILVLYLGSSSPGSRPRPYSTDIEKRISLT